MSNKNNAGIWIGTVMVLSLGFSARACYIKSSQDQNFDNTHCTPTVEPEKTQYKLLCRSKNDKTRYDGSIKNLEDIRDEKLKAAGCPLNEIWECNRKAEFNTGLDDYDIKGSYEPKFRTR